MSFGFFRRGGAVALAILSSVAAAQDAARPRFEVAAIHPCKESDAGRGGRLRGSAGNLVAECQTVENLVRWAYLGYPDGKPWPTDKATGISMNPMAGSIFRQEIKGPGWISSDGFTIEAKAPGPAAMEMMRGPMMQSLLEERFQLKVHVETRDTPVYFLTVAPGGPKLQATKDGSCISMVEFQEKYGELPRNPGDLVRRVCGPFRASIYERNPSVDAAIADRTIGLDTWGQNLAILCLQFSVGAGRPVLDRTGLTGMYDIHLDLARQDLFPVTRRPDDAEPPLSPEQKASHIAAAVQKLGLKWEAGKVAAPFVVVERVERPTEN